MYDFKRSWDSWAAQHGGGGGGGGGGTPASSYSLKTRRLVLDYFSKLRIGVDVSVTGCFCMLALRYAGDLQ